MELAQIFKKPQLSRKKLWIIAGCVVVLAAVLIGSFIYMAVLAPTKGIICKNVYIGDINVGGMTEKEAVSAIEKGFAGYVQGKKVAITYGDKTYDVYIDALNPTVDAKALAKKAMKIGRSGNFISDFFTGNRLKKGKESVKLTMALDEAALYSNIAYFGSSLMEADGVITFDYEKNEVAINIDKAKHPVDTDKVMEDFKSSVNSGKFNNVELVFSEVPNANESAELLYNLIARQPVDAQMSFVDGNVEFTDEINGVDIDRVELVKAVNQGGIITLPFTPVIADVTKEELRQSAFNVTLASYTTYFNTGVAGRTNNINKAAEKINGHIMMPGDEFSYNGVVGKRTLEAGFDYANAYSGNKIIQEVGGGICQVSSTLYAAVLYADLKVTTRYNHNLPVSYVPLGMDATVSYGTLDFCFVNNTEKPIMIKATVNGGTVHVSIDGFEKDESKKVEITTKTIATLPYGEETVEDMSITQPVVTKNGVNGSRVETYKTVYVNGVVQSSQKLHTSTYQPENKVVRVPPVVEEPVTKEPPIGEEPPVRDAPVNDAPVEVIE